MGIQVEELTRNLMPWGKEYIDFSFAGRHISEFGLVAVTSGDRYKFAGSPEFEDETSSVNGVWGQYYWGTNFKAKTYTYDLATDGMTERQFEEFKHHFRPGRYGQFYEDAWFDRYSYVRIKAVINFDFIPFQEEQTIAGMKFTGRIYKGECKISFIQDRPFKYSFYQILDGELASLKDNNDNNKAALRMMYNSNIPARDSWEGNIKCSTGSVFSLPIYKKDQINNSIIYVSDNTNIYAKAIQIPYYNPSTVNSKMNLEFTLKRSITKADLSKWKPVYFDEIYDEFSNEKEPYNVISSTDKIFIKMNSLNQNNYNHRYKYSLPEINSDVNKAINIAWHFYQENITGALVDLQERLQEGLVNEKVMIWAIKILQKIQTNQTLYRAEYSEISEGSGFVIDIQNQQLIGINQEELIENLDSTIGEIILHSGDFENVKNYDEEKAIRGCLLPNKIDVFSYPIANIPFKVDWFGYFNIMMLMLFAECNNNETADITYFEIDPQTNKVINSTFGNFYKYTLKFNGEEGRVLMDYKINQFNNDNVIASNIEYFNQNCSNIMLSNYPEMEGGDTIDISTGKIASYHMISFSQGNNKEFQVEDAKLEYKYTYI